MSFALRSVAFDDSSESIVIEYMDPGRDVKLNGVCLNHAVIIPATEQFRELLLSVQQACQQALTLALAAFATAEAVELDDEDETSPYDHPNDGGQP